MAYPHTRLQRQSEPVGRGVAWILVTGILLGLVYNYLALQGRPPHRGLPWISRPVVLESVEALPGATPVPSPVAPPIAHPRAAEPVPPPQVREPGPRASAPATAPSDPEGPPVVPDVGRPMQVQLPAVKKFWDAEAALIVDAREPAEYVQGHIPGAVNVPADEAIADPERLDAVDSGGRPIICYCGGGSCEVSIHLAEALVYQAGKKRVLVFMGGWPEWEAAGYPAEK